MRPPASPTPLPTGPTTGRGRETKEQVALRKAAIAKVAAGKATANADGVVQLGAQKFAETTTVKQDEIFTILSEFGDQARGKLGDAPGPLHNADPGARPHQGQLHDLDARLQQGVLREPVLRLRRVDEDFYEQLSNGKYSVDQRGAATGYRCPTTSRPTATTRSRTSAAPGQFIQDAGNAWYAAQVEAGKTPADINAYLAQFDVWDRYDYDGDGNFNEPDGYIDHFQAVHAGEGEDAGGGAQGEDAIWSHRWYVNGDDFGQTGPTVGAPRTSPAAPADRRHRSSGSATTRPSRRTVASACSRTSSATTSACPTSTTPPAARTAPPSGP